MLASGCPRGNYYMQRQLSKYTKWDTGCARLSRNAPGTSGLLDGQFVDHMKSALLARGGSQSAGAHLGTSSALRVLGGHPRSPETWTHSTASPREKLSHAGDIRRFLCRLPPLCEVSLGIRVHSPVQGDPLRGRESEPRSLLAPMRGGPRTCWGEPAALDLDLFTGCCPGNQGAEGQTR